VRQAGQIALTPKVPRAFADSLAPSDEVALDATGNTHAIVRALQGRVARVVVANPHKTRAIAEAKVNAAEVDAQFLAQLFPADYLPPVWVAQRGWRNERPSRYVAPRSRMSRADRLAFAVCP